MKQKSKTALSRDVNSNVEVLKFICSSFEKLLRDIGKNTTLGS